MKSKELKQRQQDGVCNIMKKRVSMCTECVESELTQIGWRVWMVLKSDKNSERRRKTGKTVIQLINIDRAFSPALRGRVIGLVRFNARKLIDSVMAIGCERG